MKLRDKTYRHITQSKKENKIKLKKKKEQKSNFANELLTYVSNISIKKNNFHI